NTPLERVVKFTLSYSTTIPHLFTFPCFIYFFINIVSVFLFKNFNLRREPSTVVSLNLLELSIFNAYSTFDNSINWYSWEIGLLRDVKHPLPIQHNLLDFIIGWLML
ncbi:hypothetical protein VIGAN_01198800, partial [Vigna angularis var. angularis]